MVRWNHTSPGVAACHPMHATPLCAARCPSCAGHGGVVKVGDLGMSRYAAQLRSQDEDGGLERTLTPGEAAAAGTLQ